MVTAEQLAQRREEIAHSADLTALLAHLTARAGPALAHLPPVPPYKALLSSDGGVCPEDATPLTFDPWSPHEHRCRQCRRLITGERHDRHWARQQHLWLAERAAHLAALAALAGNDAAGRRASELLRTYAERYLRYPNRDNVLGPSRLFFSTYLESLWLCNYLAAAMLLRESGRLDDATARGVAQVADEAATLIGEYDEGWSNRQTWNDAALVAIAVWFEDEGLAERAIQGPTGLVPHLLRGFGSDGMWYEGENYHLFALRGLLTGAAWARQAGVELAAEPPLAQRLAAALLAPARSALPDFTFPARKDSAYGVSLAQPMHLELWEIGLAALGQGTQGSASAELGSWLTALYGAPAVTPALFDCYLDDAPLPLPPAPPAPPAPSALRPASRTTLSWRALLGMLAERPSDPAPWSPTSVLLDSQGLAVLRTGGRYVSLECGPFGGGHGHPDRLHLTLHAGGVHWLPDPGTGSYVVRDLFWYRSTLAHNAPRLDGASQPPGDATCEMFQASGDWAWTRARYGDVTRTVVSGPGYVLDVLELASRSDHLIELPWHVGGTGDVVGGTWTSGALADEFVSRAERVVAPGAGPAVLELADGSRRLTAFFLFDGELLRAEGPGLPGSGTRRPFYLVRARGRGARFVTVLEPIGETALVRDVRAPGSVIEIVTAHGVHRHDATAGGWEITAGAERVRLGGAREPPPPRAPLLELDRPRPALGAALRVSEPPPLDGSLDGFDMSEPLRLELEDQYRRSEEAFSGPEDFSAVAYVAWDDDALYLAAEVTKPELCFRPPGAPPLRLDNEPDDIHSDGIQLYLRGAEGAGAIGFLVVPEGQEGGPLRVRGAGDAPGAAETVRGAWRRTRAGYRVTLAVGWPEGYRAHVGGQLGFDLIINELTAGRVRRAGQLVWSGGNGWVWLRGDRQDPDRMGILELAG